ncbi:MAG: sporulation protein YqfC [Bacillota bacterium]
MRVSPAKKIRTRLADTFELPKDVLLDLPRLTIIGTLQLVVENHRGLIEYTPARVRISLGAAELVVTGTDLVISSAYEEEIMILGHLGSVEFTRELTGGE